MAQRPSTGTSDDIIGLAAKAIAEITSNVVKDDKNARDVFAQTTVSELRDQFPDYSVIAVAVEHSIEGPNIHQHAELEYKLGTSQGYEVYFVKEGDEATFTREGDGGYINWAYICSPDHCKQDDNKLNMF